MKMFYEAVLISHLNIQKYSSEEAFIEIEEALILFFLNTKNISIIGDFNSRTSKLIDYIVDDLELFDIIDIVDDTD
jgi:hypothetical protein